MGTFLVELVKRRKRRKKMSSREGKGVECQKEKVSVVYGDEDRVDVGLGEFE